jgi:hypothetical protein
VVDDDGLFISGPAVVETLHDNRPVPRRFDFSFPGLGGLLPQPEMAEDAFYDVAFMNQADDLHLSPASARVPAIVPDHLKLVPDPDPGMLLRDMLSDGGDEFFGREDLEVLFYLALSLKNGQD